MLLVCIKKFFELARRRVRDYLLIKIHVSMYECGISIQHVCAAQSVQTGEACYAVFAPWVYCPGSACESTDVNASMNTVPCDISCACVRSISSNTCILTWIAAKSAAGAARAAPSSCPGASSGQIRRPLPLPDTVEEEAEERRRKKLSLCREKLKVWNKNTSTVWW